MKEKVRKWLLDLLAAADQIESFVDGMTFGSYVEDAKTQRAVEMDFLIIGETLIRIRDADLSVLNKVSHHNDIIGFRNILAHGYDQIDDRVVWNAVTRYLPVLKKEVLQLTV